MHNSNLYIAQQQCTRRVSVDTTLEKTLNNVDVWKSSFTISQLFLSPLSLFLVTSLSLSVTLTHSVILMFNCCIYRHFNSLLTFSVYQFGLYQLESSASQFLHIVPPNRSYSANGFLCLGTLRVLLSICVGGEKWANGIPWQLELK